MRSRAATISEFHDGANMATARVKFMMSPQGFDRRHSHVSVQDLRRRLRDADEERFHLEAALGLAANQWLSAQDGPAPGPPRRAVSRLATVAAFVVCVTGAIVIAWLSRPATAGTRISDVQLESREITNSPPALPPAVARRMENTAVSAVASLPPRQVRQTGTRVTNVPRPPLPSDEKVRRHVPRPLSPGEFGRRLAGS
jgi:hypothetical protein